MAIRDVLYGSVPSPCRSGSPGGETPRVSSGGLGGPQALPTVGPPSNGGGHFLAGDDIISGDDEGGGGTNLAGDDIISRDDQGRGDLTRDNVCLVSIEIVSVKYEVGHGDCQLLFCFSRLCIGEMRSVKCLLSTGGNQKEHSLR